MSGLCSPFLGLRDLARRNEKGVAVQKQRDVAMQGLRIGDEAGRTRWPKLGQKEEAEATMIG
jgi:hypothetical protein